MTTVRIGSATLRRSGNGRNNPNNNVAWQNPPRRPWYQNEGRPLPGGGGSGGGGGGNGGTQNNEDAVIPFSVPPGRMGIGILNTTDRLILPYAPRSVSYSDMSSEWVEVQRDGNREPLLIKKQKRLPKVRVEAWLGSHDWHRSIKHELDILKKIADANKPVIVVWSSWESGYWRVIDFTVTSEMRNDVNGEITRATFTMDFARASDAEPLLSPAKGGGKGPKGGGNGDGKDRPKKYTVKKGDTLMKIGVKFYHNDSAWRKIAKVNKIDDPKANAALKVGRVLTLP